MDFVVNSWYFKHQFTAIQYGASMQSVGLIIKRSADQALDLAEKICRFLRQRGTNIVFEKSCSDLASVWAAQSSENLADKVDLIVSLGGDGTLLQAAAQLNSRPVPVLGVNLGRVGFMAEIAPDEALEEIELALVGKSSLGKRMMLAVTAPDGRQRKSLNEVVIHWTGIARIIDLGIRVGCCRDFELRADGLIISTPIGSSAYSYAAGGPLVHPDVEGILLTPICPYSGLKRPLLVPPDFPIQLTLSKGENFTMTIDGHTHISMAQGSSVIVEKAPFPFVIVKSRKRDYFDVLDAKLGLVR
ncbi:MAG: NAD(+)/NADH kinase [Desulfomonilaceae bacterium]